MIKARIRWCTCRVENSLTLGKLLSLWFCFLLHSIFFLISQTSYRTYKIISSYEFTCPVMGTIFLVISVALGHFSVGDSAHDALPLHTSIKHFTDSPTRIYKICCNSSWVYTGIVKWVIHHPPFKLTRKMVPITGRASS